MLNIALQNASSPWSLMNSVASVSEEEFPSSKEVHFTLDLATLGEEKIAELKKLLAAHAGDSKIYFHLKESGRRTHVIKARSQGVKLDYDLVAQLSATIGQDNIRLIPSSGS